jgi:glycosyltransferase involved in cell wall biosynthesis
MLACDDVEESRREDKGAYAAGALRRMSRKAPLVSVMMPVINPHPVYFRAAVRSLLCQTLREIELIIVEDPSESCAEEMVSEFDDARIRYFKNSSRTGLIEQRNKALFEARADFVACLDADDVAVPERLQKQFEFLNDHTDVDVLGSQLQIINESGKSVGYRVYPATHEEIVTAMCEYNAIAQPAVMCRRKVLIDSGGYQYRAYPVNEDYELWSRLMLRGVRFANHSEALLLYRIHPQGTKIAMMRRMLLATIDVKKHFWIHKMTLRARIRYWGEHLLLRLPPSWVFRLFTLIQYRGIPRTELDAR